MELVESDEENTITAKKTYVHRDNVYGNIEGVESGEWWETRMECSQAGVHRLIEFLM